jgi:hypothetical protein
MEGQIAEVDLGWDELLGFRKGSLDIARVVTATRHEAQTMAEVVRHCSTSRNGIRAVALAEALGYVRVRSGPHLGLVELAP